MEFFLNEINGLIRNTLKVGAEETYQEILQLMGNIEEIIKQISNRKTARPDELTLTEQEEIRKLFNNILTKNNQIERILFQPLYSSEANWAI